MAQLNHDELNTQEHTGCSSRISAKSVLNCASYIAAKLRSDASDVSQLGIEERLQRRTRRTPAEFTAAAAAAEAHWALADWKPFEPAPGTAAAAGGSQLRDTSQAQLLLGHGGRLGDPPLDPASAAPAQPPTASDQAVSGCAAPAGAKVTAVAQVPRGSPAAAAASADQQRQDGGETGQYATVSGECMTLSSGDSGGDTAGQVGKGEQSHREVMRASDVNGGEAASASNEGLQLSHIQT